MSEWMRTTWPYALLITAPLVLVIGLALPRFGRSLALGTGSLATAATAFLVIFVAVTPKYPTPPHCIPYRSPTWYHAGDLAIFGITFAALSLSAAIAAIIRHEHVRQSIAIGLLATGSGIASFFVGLDLAICGA